MNHQSRTQLRLKPSCLGRHDVARIGDVHQLLHGNGIEANATFISPLSTRFFNSPRPRMPPTKSIRLSERGVFDAEHFIQYQIGGDGYIQHSNGVVIIISTRFGSKAVPLSVQIEGTVMQFGRLIDVLTFLLHNEILAHSSQKLLGVMPFKSFTTRL